MIPPTKERLPESTEGTFRYDREVLFLKARNAIFALERTLTPDTDDRKALFRARVVLCQAWENAEADAKAAPFDKEPTS